MRTYIYPSDQAEKRLQKIANRGVSFPAKTVNSVSRILRDVNQGGDEALLDYVARFDSPGLTPKTLVATDKEIKAAVKSLTPEFEKALDKAIANISAFHARQKQNSWFTTDRPGTFLGQVVSPVDAAGVYVPGGTAGQTPLVSSVLMGAIPAKVAGVPEIILATPAGKNGKVHPYLLAAAAKVGVGHVFKMGSAWAVAAMAYGTETVPKVDVIVGPGNIYVTVAKKLVAGMVGIDMIAGPSEVLIIADETADPDSAAADLLSQAEHDPLAASYLIATRRSVANRVKKCVEAQLENLSRKEIARESIKINAAAFVVPDLDTAADIANRIAPEHLELLVAEPFALFPKIRHAGAIFLGNHTPEPVGDYVAGPNHVLPTAGTARFSSALSVDHFIKKTSVIHYSPEVFAEDAADIMELAGTEGLTAHANAIRLRLEKGKK